MHTWITSVFAYQDFRIKRLVWMLKYKNARRVAKLFAPHMGRALTELVGEEERFLGAQIVLVPIPLSQKRKRMRGYNQAELLARKIVEYMPEGSCRVDTTILKKDIETTPQADIHKRSDRLKNLGQCFSVSRQPRGGETIVLVDDVTTTGATFAEARRALKEAGYRKVRALSVGH